MLDCRFHSKEGYDKGIGELVYMLEITRKMTAFELQGLTQDKLDYLYGKGSNSIGMLLSHIASIEFFHQVTSFENRTPNEQEEKEWSAALQMGEQGRDKIKGNNLDFYLTKLSEVREKTYGFLKKEDDQWLYAERQLPDGTPYNNYYLWFHVVEDEISHRGQIKSIKRLIHEES